MRSGIEYKPIHGLVGTYLSYLISVGFLDAASVSSDAATEALPALQDLSHIDLVGRNNRV